MSFLRLAPWIAAVALLTPPAFARSADVLAAERHQAALRGVGHATYWLQAGKVIGRAWQPREATGWTLTRADKLRAAIAGPRKLVKTFPFGHGEIAGITYTYTGSFAVTYETRLDAKSGQYDHVTSLLAAPAGEDAPGLDARKGVKVVRD